MADDPAGGERPSWLKRAAGSAQSVAAIVAVVVSLVNIWFIFIDRERQARREVYQQQIEMTKFYFERVANLKAEDWCVQAPLFAQASAIMAGLEPQALRLRNARAHAAQAEGGTGIIVRERGVEALAATIVGAIDERAVRSRDCDAAVGEASALGGSGSGGFSASSYAAQAAVAQVGRAARPPPEPAPAPAPAPEARPRMTVYIQFAEGAQAQANALRERINHDLAPAYTAPGVEKVRQAPGRDQIRIYRAADEERARELAQAVGLKEAQIVNLSRSYPNLPPGRMEIWLSAP